MAPKSHEQLSKMEPGGRPTPRTPAIDGKIVESKTSADNGRHRRRRRIKGDRVFFWSWISEQFQSRLKCGAHIVLEVVSEHTTFSELFRLSVC